MSDVIKNAEAIKQSCCNFYESDSLSLFLGDSLHPGGESLTYRIGEILNIEKGSSVLDMASGKGRSGILLAKNLGCYVTGVDISEKNVLISNRSAAGEGVADYAKFINSDAERIELYSSQFDFVISECSLCTFPDKDMAIGEAYRLLKRGGSIAIGDVNIEAGLSKDYMTMAHHVACIAGALPRTGYTDLLKEHGFNDISFEDHSDSISSITQKLRTLIDSWELLGGLSKEISEISSLTPTEAREMLNKFSAEVNNGLIGYGIYSARKAR